MDILAFLGYAEEKTGLHALTSQPHFCHTLGLQDSRTHSPSKESKLTWRWPLFVYKFWWNEGMKKCSLCMAGLVLGCVDKHHNSALPSWCCFPLSSHVQLVFIFPGFSACITFYQFLNNLHFIKLIYFLFWLYICLNLTFGS